MNLKSTYNKIAEDWFKDHRDDLWWKEGTEKFLSCLPKGASILDVGCGAGVKSGYLTKNGFKVTGIDFSEKMIEIAKRESPEISFDIVDIYKIEKYPKKFDAIFAQAALLHISKDRIVEVLSKLKEKVNLGGFLYIAVKEKRKGEVEEGIKKENDYGYEYERFFSYYSMAELEKYLTDLDLEIVFKTITNAGKTNWLQIVGRKK